MGMRNRCVKFELKIPNRLGENVRKPQGDTFLTHTEWMHLVAYQCPHGESRQLLFQIQNTKSSVVVTMHGDKVKV